MRRRRTTCSSGIPWVLALGVVTVWVMLPGAAMAYEKYADDTAPNPLTTNCAQCHGDFRASPYISLSDGQNWNDDLHDVHRNTMLGGDCSTCHTSGGRSPVFLASSNGGSGLSPISCVGCHGRLQDASSGTLGSGAGLRQHHWNADASHPSQNLKVCLSCHADSDPATFFPVGENILPDYYANPGSGHNIPTDPCNPSPGFPEDYKGTTQGLDNDGDNIYDTADPDCAAAVCGNGVVEPGEECDDGNTSPGDCCSATCAFEASGSSCDDGVGCTSPDTCDGAGSCAGPPDDALCDDGQFCNGAETCDAVADCQAGTPVSCDDGVGCTVDSCDETADVCVNAPDDASCDDGQFCNGVETCNAVSDCQPGSPVSCDDGVGCTVDSCDETADLCVNAPDDASCDDGQFCNGVETCNAVSDCQPGSPVDCDDSDICTDDSCDETSDLCDNIFDPSNDPTCLVAVCGDGSLQAGEECDDGNTIPGDCCSATCTFEAAGSSCDDGVGCTLTDVCDGAGSCAGTPDDASCDDGQFCNGAETCDAIFDCQGGTPVDCSDGLACTVDSCDETADVCVNAPDDALCDDGRFCNGLEICDPVAGCQPGAPASCDDGVGCTADSCDAIADACVNTPDDAACDDGQFCNGAEICDALTDCQVATPVDCDDSDICTDDSCDETADQCTNVFDATNDPTCQQLCPDADNDGFSAAGGGCGPVDCDDGDPTSNPAASEICDDDRDNDCDGLVDAADDACGFTTEWRVRQGPLQDPDYAGSETCAGCHDSHAAEWTNTLHARVLIRPGDAQAAGFALPLFDPASGIELRSWADVLFVIGQKWKTRYVDRNGFVQGTEWNYLLGDWAVYNSGQLRQYDCGACHTTGYDPAATFEDSQGQPVPGVVGSWVEYGVGCEACHGPGAAHAAAPTRDNINRITFPWYDPDSDGTPDPVDIRSAVVCGNCHYRTDRRQIQTDGRSREQYNDWLVSAHASSLKFPTVNTYCAQCHSPGNADYFASEHNFTNFEPTAATHVACLSCHDPHRTSQSRWASLQFPPGGQQDARDRQARLVRYRGSDNDPTTNDYDTFQDSTALCRDCHRGPVGFRRHKDASEPEEVVLNPPFSAAQPTFIVPHREHVDEGRAECVDCHMSYSRRSANSDDVRTHSLLPNERKLTGNFASPHFSETCAPCHPQAQDCEWCHSDFADGAPQPPTEPPLRPRDTSRQREPIEK